MVKAMILCADGAEESELIGTYDILSRTGEFKIDLVNTMDRTFIVTSHGLHLNTEITISSIDPNNYDLVILPGGKVGVDNLIGNKKVLSFVQTIYENDKVVAAICAAPSILGKLGILRAERYTCFPGFETEGGHYIDDAGAVTDGTIITGRSMYYTIGFAEQIVKKFLGEEGLKKIFPGTRGLKA